MKGRRHFMKIASLGSGALLVAGKMKLPVNTKNNIDRFACQHYTWLTYFQREGREWMKDMEESFQACIKAGFKGYEPSFTRPEEVLSIQQNLEQYKLWSKSMYVNSTLHEPELVEQSIQEVLAIAMEAKSTEIKILVTNPTPIRWGGPENKSDEQLKAQALALNVLGQELKSMGLTLAYHNHDAEMRESAREFHHMLRGTDPENVKLCLDAHWIYRGSGNSEVALFDIVDMYADRIVELHLRQSENGIWSEVFEEGDIDYQHLATMLNNRGLRPHIVLEQAIEVGTPQTMSAIEAIRLSMENVGDIFS